MLGGLVGVWDVRVAWVGVAWVGVAWVGGMCGW